jgi:hypothetical protein
MLVFQGSLAGTAFLRGTIAAQTGVAVTLMDRGRRARAWAGSGSRLSAKSRNGAKLRIPPRIGNCMSPYAHHEPNSVGSRMEACGSRVNFSTPAALFRSEASSLEIASQGEVQVDALAEA